MTARLLGLNEERADLRQIASLISNDPALSTAVLRLVNSPLFGVRQPVRGVLQAVALLGLSRLRALITTAALRMMVRPTSASPALTRCWRHSVACALIAEDVASSRGLDKDAAYTAGLLHDIGCFAMLSCWPKEYSHLLDTCVCDQVLDREFESLGITHPAAGAFLLHHWGLPPDLVLVTREHHNPMARGPAVLQLVSLACHAADSFGFRLTAEEPDDSSDDTLDSAPYSADVNWLRIADGINQLDCL